MYKALAFTLIAIYSLIGLKNLSQYNYCPDQSLFEARAQASKNKINAIFSDSKKEITLNPDQHKFLLHPTFFGHISFISANWLIATFNMDRLSAWHLPIFFSSILFLFFFFFLIELLFDPRIAFYSVALMAFFPRFIGHAQSNPKNIPLMLFVVLSFFLIFKAWKKERYFFSVAAGAAIGLGIGTELNGVYIWAIFIGYLLVTHSFLSPRFERISQKRRRLLVCSIVISIFVLFCAWPLLWADPLHLIKSIHYFNSAFYPQPVLYLGNFYLVKDLPWHYTLVHLIISTPIFYWIFIILGILYARSHWVNAVFIGNNLFLTGWFFLPFFVNSLPETTRYDDIRHVFFAIPPLLVYGAFGIVELESILKRVGERFYKYGFVLLLVIFGFYQFWQVAKIHPYEESYFNELFRFIYPNSIEKIIKFPTWTDPSKEAVDWLNKNADKNSKVCAPNLGRLYLLRNDLIQECTKMADYSIYIPNDQAKEVHSGGRVVYEISRYNSVLLAIYKKQKVFF